MQAFVRFRPTHSEQVRPILAESPDTVTEVTQGFMQTCDNLMWASILDAVGSMSFTDAVWYAPNIDAFLASLSKEIPGEFIGRYLAHIRSLRDRKQRLIALRGLSSRESGQLGVYAEGSVSKVEMAIFTPPVQRHIGSQTSQ